MNESLIRDLHDTQIEEIAEVKNAIAELAQKPTATQTDIAKVQMMIANIKLPEADNTEILKLVNQLSKQCATADKLNSLELLCRGLKAKLENNSEQLGDVRQQMKEPVSNKYHHIIDFRSTAGIIVMVCMVLITAAAVSAWVYELNSNKQERENDIKYRYIKMTVGTGGDYIDQIEEYVRNNPEGEALQNMKERVDSYERAVADKLRAEEQARLRATKAAELDKQIEELKHN